MDTNNDEALIVIFIVPTRDMGKRADTIDTCIGPEVNKNNFSFKIFDRYRFVGIEPMCNTDEIRSW